MIYICSHALLCVTGNVINLRACRIHTMFLIVDRGFPLGPRKNYMYTNWCINCRQIGNHKVVTRFSLDVFLLLSFFFFFSALAMGLCVSMIAYIRLPSLKVSTLLLIGLLIYDVFWVSFGQIQLCFYQSFFNCNNKIIKRMFVPTISNFRLLISCSCQ